MRQDTDSRPREFIRVLKDLELADPFDDEIREVLPSLAAAQRADPFFGPIFGYLEVALSDQAEAWLQAAMPADPLPGPQRAGTINMATVVDIAAACFLDDEGILRRHRLRTRNCHSVRVPRDSEDRGLICVPRTLRHPLLTFYHERSGHAGRGRLYDILSAEFWWNTMSTDSNVFVGNCHVCLSNRACHVSNHVPDGQFPQTLMPSEEVVADPVGPLPETPEGYTYLLVLVDRASRWTEAYPMVNNSAEHLLAAFLLFIWRRGCPKILYSDRGGNLLSFLAYKVYQRLGVTKVSGSSHRHNVSGMCERTIQSVLTMLTCDMASEQHHTSWYQRVPPTLWSVNTSTSASTGYSPFFLEHGRQPRDLASRAFDMADVPASSVGWVELMNQRLELARKIHSAVDTQAKVAQARRSALPKQARSEPPALLPGSFCYYQIQKFTRSANDGQKFVPKWSGPYIVRSKVPGSEHRYLISRSETSASFDAHITRLRASPHKTFGVVALESHVSDGGGAGRGFHLLDPTIVFEIDRVLEVNEKEVLISFLGNEINSRWVTREVMSEQGLDDLVADFVDGGRSTQTSPPTTRTGAKFTMDQTTVARLENKRTHESSNRAYHVGE